jgi:ATP-dependent protease HslVU (ClpYQ) ATPase subunit
MSEDDFGYRKFISSIRGLGDGRHPTDLVGIQQDFRAIRIVDGINIGRQLRGPVAPDHLALVDKACVALGIARPSDLCSEIAERLSETFTHA